MLVCLQIKRQMIPTGYNLRPIIIWICLFHQKVFESDFINLKKQSFVMTTTWSLVFDYKELAAEQIDSFVSETEDMMQETSDAYNFKIDEPAYLEVLREYQTSAKKVRTTLLILQFPVLALCWLSFFMISRQMLDLEQNEIALLKSRGSSKKQIILIYFLQSVILSAMSAVVGLPLGYFLCKALGSTNGFLEFIQRKALHITLGTSVFFVYAWCDAYIHCVHGVTGLPRRQRYDC